MSKSAEIGERIGVGVAVAVGSTLVLGTIGSILTGNPAPLFAALKVGGIAGGVGAGTSGNNDFGGNS